MLSFCQTNIVRVLSILMIVTFSQLAKAESSKNPVSPKPSIAASGPVIKSGEENASRNISIGATKDIIAEQLEAIRKRDAHLLWKYISKDYQGDYRSPNEAMKDIRRSKKPLFEHLSYSFLDSTVQNEKVVEKVELVTRSGGKVLAFFKLTKDDDGQWKIDHITLLQSESQAI